VKEGIIRKMKEKYISETFLKDVKEYELKMSIKKDYFLCIKQIKTIEKPFYLKDGICLIDNDYYIIEILYPNKHYTTRIFLNNKKEEILYYYDIVDKVKMDNQLMIPYYEDLYLDVVVRNDNIYVLDEKEFEDAFNNKFITANQYNLAKNTIDSLILEIKQNKNIIDLNIKELLKNS